MDLSQCLEYRALPMQFYIFTLSGVWCPSNWTSLLKLSYNMYTTTIAISGILFWASMFVNLIITKNESEYFYENVFAISTLTYAMYKEFFVLKKRKEIQQMLKLSFDDEWYRPFDNREIQIIDHYAHETRWVTQVYAIGIIAGLATKAIMPMLNSNSAWVLPIEAWYPYNTSNLKNYLFAYTQQLMGGIPLICLHISVDSLFVGLILQMCIQLKLLQYRLQKTFSTDIDLQEEKNIERNIKISDVIIANYAFKHQCIFRLGNYLNQEFRGILAGQVMITIPNICINVYLLSQHRGGITLHLVDSFLCFTTCLMQIFLYCWYGNKIILLSIDVANTAYTTNWLSLNISSKKKLLTIMVRATRSIQFAAGTFIMNIDSFIEIIKTSYSAYRVLQKTS
ncbi:odorant receptor 103 [Nasonia vitripennis]|uniref:Odorant receptor n=1 Tax=Nasonia vitripennis TaxID=7425 RepID=A0A7M6W8I4_NASVI|nr:odorant receptor 103 [Nasonia vitripennis]